MNLNFVKKNENLFSCSFVKDHILELYEEKGPKEGFFRAFNFDPENNTLFEISPDIKKYKSIIIQNCMYDSDKFYFASYVKHEDRIEFSVFEYDFDLNTTRFVFDFFEDENILDAAHKIKIFVLNSSNYLVQTERLSFGENPNLMGVISFNLFMFNAESHEFKNVEIPDFVNNGINKIKPIGENRILIKCGYSFVEDRRIAKLSEKEALIESIYITSVTELIADISLNKTTGNMRLLDTAYFEKCISRPFFKDEFVLYKLADVVGGTCDINFVNINTLERFKYKKEFDPDDKHIKPLIICNTPYIKITDGNKERFLNLTNGLEDMEFVDEKFVATAGNILIFEKQRRKKTYLRIYSFPYLGLLYEEQYTLGNIAHKNDEYYIYI